RAQEGRFAHHGCRRRHSRTPARGAARSAARWRAAGRRHEGGSTGSGSLGTPAFGSGHSETCRLTYPALSGAPAARRRPPRRALEALGFEGERQRVEAHAARRIGGGETRDRGADLIERRRVALFVTRQWRRWLLRVVRVRRRRMRCVPAALAVTAPSSAPLA